jgi:hypothetical protein
MRYFPEQQLLVLVLQIVAILALDPCNHKALCELGLPDALSQLLLPSDEWYYTNHSTKYARFVKHHAARTLVYLGLQHRVNLRISVYDILQGNGTPFQHRSQILFDWVCIGMLRDPRRFPRLPKRTMLIFWPGTPQFFDAILRRVVKGLIL